MFSKIGVSQNFAKLKAKHLCRSLFLKRVPGFHPVTLSKTYSDTGIAKFANLSGKPFSWNTSRRMLLSITQWTNDLNWTYIWLQSKECLIWVEFMSRDHMVVLLHMEQDQMEHELLWSKTIQGTRCTSVEGVQSVQLTRCTRCDDIIVLFHMEQDYIELEQDYIEQDYTRYKVYNCARCSRCTICKVNKMWPHGSLVPYGTRLYRARLIMEQDYKVQGVWGIQGVQGV